MFIIISSRVAVARIFEGPLQWSLVEFVLLAFYKRAAATPLSFVIPLTLAPRPLPLDPYPVTFPYFIRRVTDGLVVILQEMLGSSDLKQYKIFYSEKAIFQ